MLKRGVGNVWLVSKSINSSLGSLVMEIPTQIGHRRL